MEFAVKPPSDKTSAKTAAQLPVFCWPAPPYAIYGEAQPWLQVQECDFEDLDGKLHACLLDALDSHKHAALIRFDATRPLMTLPFVKLRRLTLKKLVHPQSQADIDEFPDILGYRATVDYQLQMRTREAISGKTVGFVQTDFGLFLFPPVGTHGSAAQMFIPREAYLNFSMGDRIGNILVQDHLVSSAQVNQAVQEQSRLRHRKLGDYLLDTAVVTPEQLLQALDQQARMPMIRLGAALIRLGFINQAQLTQALERQNQDHSVPLGQLLVDMGLLTRRDLNTALARKMGYPVVDLSQFPVEADALKHIPMSTAMRLNVMPLMSRHNLTVVAAVDPTQRKMLAELSFLVQGRVIAALGDELQIRDSIKDTYKKFALQDTEQHEPQPGVAASEPEHLASSTELLESMVSVSAPEEDEKPIEQSDNTLVRLINTMIIEAEAQGVSDIHVESQPRHAKVRIRFRKDGLMAPYLELPYTYRSALVARLKIMANLDISEHRKPQDGKIDFSKFASNHPLELRIATVPTNNGLENVVMRLLASTKPVPITQLGLSRTNLELLQQAVQRPYGMVLCVGPTGSGKTTTLHSVLDFLNTPERKIWTAEDPVEITQPDLSQVQVNPKIDWTFAKALRAFLRADPDIIMVGEIRDRETAQIAIEASLTGHLLLSTLHTNSAAETVIRLIDMGMDPFNFADSLLAVLAQRLARRLCSACRTRVSASDARVEELLNAYLNSFPSDLRPAREQVLADWQQRFAVDGKLQFYSAPGCRHCLGKGMAGRVGLHELLTVTPAIRHLIQTGAHAEKIQHEAFHSGTFRTLRQDGIDKVWQGLTSIEEVRANSNS